MDVNLEAKTLQGAGLIMEAVGNDQQDIGQLQMQFTLRAVEGNAGALFGTVRNNVQLNLSSIDGFIYGEQSGTLFGLIARDKEHPIQVNMVDSRYCILGNIKDTCLPDPSYKSPDEDYDPGKNDQGEDTGKEGEETPETPGDVDLVSIRYLRAEEEEEKPDPCCVDITEGPTNYTENRCVFIVSATSTRQDCPCDAFGNCPEEGSQGESECLIINDMRQSFGDQ